MRPAGSDSPKTVAASARALSVWDELVADTGFCKQRNLLAPFLGYPAWWLVNLNRSGGRVHVQVDDRAIDIWHDPRNEGQRLCREVVGEIARRFGATIPFDASCRRHVGRVHCIPLFSGPSQAHMLVLTELEDSLALKSALDLLYSNLKSILSNVTLELELRKLSDTLRPRMIALSAIHTIHRLCSITTSTNDLYQRLAALLAQIMRCRECSIYSSDRSAAGRNGLLWERGRFPVQKTRGGRTRVVRPGHGIEGRVARTAKRFLRRHCLCVPLIDEDVFGVIALAKKKDRRGFTFADEEILMTMAEEAVVAIKNTELYEEQKSVTVETIQSLAKILGTRFAPHRRISQRTLLALAGAVGEELKLSSEEREALQSATILKDASKLGLSDEILKKSDNLTGEERQFVRERPVQGAKLLQSFRSLRPVAPIILASHEHFDGSGYPYGLKGRRIPIGARILCVLNAFDALVGGRPYRSRASVQEALNELRRNSATQFDPRVVEVFLRVLERKKIQRLLRGEQTLTEGQDPSVAPAAA